MRPGSTQRTAAGVVRVDTVEEVDPDTPDRGRRRARPASGRWPSCGGCSTAATARTSTGCEVCLAGADPRVALREQAELSDEDRRAVDDAAGPLGRRPGRARGRGRCCG